MQVGGDVPLDWWIPLHGKTARISRCLSVVQSVLQAEQVLHLCAKPPDVCPQRAKVVRVKIEIEHGISHSTYVHDVSKVLPMRAQNTLGQPSGT